MGKNNIDKGNEGSNDISSSESNNNSRSNIADEVQMPFVIEESEKQIEEGDKKTQTNVSNKANNTVNQTQTPQNSISNAADFLGDINTIKDELIKLPLNPAEKDYLEVYVFPLLSVLLDLSTTSLNLSSTTSKLAVSYVTNPKTSKLKDTEHLVYDINEKCEDVYKVLKQRINYVIKCNEK